jgi:hypothetical protein
MMLPIMLAVVKRIIAFDAAFQKTLQSPSPVPNPEGIKNYEQK